MSRDTVRVWRRISTHLHEGCQLVGDRIACPCGQVWTLDRADGNGWVPEEYRGSHEARTVQITARRSATVQ